MVSGNGSPHAPAVWLSDDDAPFLGSGFHVGPDLVVTCAHVVHGRGPVTVHGALGAEAARTVLIVPADPPDGAAFHPAPDLAVLRTAWRADRPVAVLGTAEAAPGSELSAHGFSTVTATDGVQPDSARLTVVGPSGGFVRLGNGWVRKGLSGSMLLGAGGRVVGVVKGTEDHHEPVGGWMTPLGRLRQVLDLAGWAAPASPPARPAATGAAGATGPAATRAAGRRQWADALARIPVLDEERVRHGLVQSINEELPADQGIRVPGDSLAVLHLERIAGACLDNRDPCTALGALVAAVRRLAGGHRAVGELTTLLAVDCGGGSDEAA
ncbi:trypsin-like peptidase domain-containing protein [Kitasatospora sp. NPDC056327]|uniref:trypsin-like peptidase domain-containing protein n=1 Tax=Kitasatospora sp. NPDC056327 TaxID=3345785 RepID=UPI0035D86288